MSAPAEDVVQHLEEEEEMDPENFVTEDDALEVIEMEEVGEHMDDSDEEGAQGEELDQGDDQEEEMDGAEQLLASGFDDSTATYFGHQQPIFSVALHPVDPLIAISGGEDDMGHIWRTDTGETVAQLAGHTDSVTSVGFSFDGEMVATGGMDGLVRVWRRVKGSTDYLSWEFLLQLEGPDEVNWLDWHPKGNLLLCGGADGTVWIWQLPTGLTLHVLTGHITSVTCGRWTPDGKRVITGSEDSSLILWDPRTGEPIHKLLPADGRFRLNGGINAIAVNTACTVAICGGAQGGLRAVNLVQGTVLAQMAGHEEGSSIEAVAFSDVPVIGAVSVTVLVSVGTDGRVCTWEANTFKLRSTGIHEDAVTSLAFAPGTTNFVTGSADRTLKVWDYRTGGCIETLLGHIDVIHSCAVSKDGKMVVSGGDDGRAKVFLTGQTRAVPAM